MTVLKLNAAQFNDELRRVAERTNTRLERVIGLFALAAHQSIKFGSPITGSPGQKVKTGRLRDSWTLGLNHPVFANDGAADSPLNTNPGDISRFVLGDVIYIATNLVYAQRMEYEHPTNSGSLRQTVAHAQALLDAIAAKLRTTPPGRELLYDGSGKEIR